jgi:hypothetical protein
VGELKRTGTSNPSLPLPSQRRYACGVLACVAAGKLTVEVVVYDGSGTALARAAAGHLSRSRDSDTASLAVAAAADQAACAHSLQDSHCLVCVANAMSHRILAEYEAAWAQINASVLAEPDEDTTRATPCTQIELPLSLGTFLSGEHNRRLCRCPRCHVRRSLAWASSGMVGSGYSR